MNEFFHKNPFADKETFLQDFAVFKDGLAQS